MSEGSAPPGRLRAPTEHEREMMEPGLRAIMAAATLAFGLAATPVAAQDTAAPAPPAEDVVGPPQLQNFSLGGTVTRSAETPPARTEAPPSSTPQQAQSAAPAPTAAATATPRAPAPARTEAPRHAEAQPQLPATNPRLEPQDALGRSATIRLPPARGIEAPPTPAPAGAFASTPAAAPAALPAPDPLPLDDGGASPMPWLLALLLAGGGAAYYLRRQQSGHAFAGAGAGTIQLGGSAPQPPAPQAPAQPRAAAPAYPQPHPRVPPAAPRPPAVPGGIVSTRLRPWIDIEFVPGRTVVDQQRATVECEVVLHNPGSAHARDVLVEARMFNAGPEQDREIEAFFASPVGKGEREPAIAPLQSIRFTMAVGLTHQQLRQFEVDGRRLFVPLIGVTALYRWSGGDAQTSAAYLVGRDTKGDKLAPFRLDLGPRIFRGLSARELGVRVRK